MKRVAIALICLLSVFFAHAEKYSYDANEDAIKEASGTLILGGGSKFFQKPKNFEKAVAVLGKVIVKYNGDLERVKTFRDLGSRFAEKENIYRPFGVADKIFYSEGEVFCTAIDFINSAEKRITSQRDSLKNRDDNAAIWYDTISYYFNGSNKMKLQLPISYNIQVPEGENFLYVGTLVYEFEGDDFSLKRITILDEYDEAQEELNRLFKNKSYKLCRVELNP